MKTYSQKVRSAQLKRVSFQAESVEPAAGFLLGWLQQAVEGETNFKHGETIQFGFWILQCRIDDGHLQLLAPELEPPLRWTEDLTHVLHTTTWHQYVPESFDLPMDVPGIAQTALVGKHFDSFPMLINRLAPTEGRPKDSGWFFGSIRDDVDNNDPSQLEVISLFEAVSKAPWILEFLSLPKGIQVVFETENPVVLKDYEPLTPKPGSYIAQQASLRGRNSIRR